MGSTPDRAQSNHVLELTIRTPIRTIVSERVLAVNAEDASGRFGLRPGAEPLLAALVPSVLTYRTTTGEERLVAVTQGFLRSDRRTVNVDVRAAVPFEDLSTVGMALRKAAEDQAAREQSSRAIFHQLFDRLALAMADEERRR